MKNVSKNYNFWSECTETYKCWYSFESSFYGEFKNVICMNVQLILWKLRRTASSRELKKCIKNSSFDIS